MATLRYHGIEVEYSPEGGTMGPLRLSVSYDAELYFDYDIKDPLHPDRQLDAAVGEHHSDGGMGCGRRDLGWENFVGDVAEVTKELLLLPFPVEVKWIPKRGE